MRLRIAAVFIALTTTAAVGHGYKLGTMEIIHPWTRATSPAAKIAAGFLKVKNNGPRPDFLIAATSDATGRIEIHRSKVENGVAEMRPVERLEIKPGETLELAPGGLHLMFIELKRPLVEKERVKGTLVFKSAGSIEIEYVISPAGGHESHVGH